VLEHPEDPGQRLIEAAAAWSKAGEHDRAESTIRRVMDGGSEEDVAYAWPVLIEILFDAGKEDEAREELERLSASEPSDITCVNTAELLEERGEYKAALAWADRGVTLWGGDADGVKERLSDAPGPFVAMSSGTAMRARLRQMLGHQPDEIDKIIERFETEFDRQAREIAAKFFARNRGDADGRPRLVRGMFWPRGALAEVSRRWPALIPPSVVESGCYWSELEAQFADAAGTGGRIVEIVPLDPDGLAKQAADEGLPVEDDGLRWRYREVQAERGLEISWPPPRNGPCWCGSGSKYKKCCGHPANRQPHTTHAQATEEP
jgi:tetratricopeptide (TPR) repeat protein